MNPCPGAGSYAATLMGGGEIVAYTPADLMSQTAVPSVAAISPTRIERFIRCLVIYFTSTQTLLDESSSTPATWVLRFTDCSPDFVPGMAWNSRMYWLSRFFCTSSR